MISIAVLMGIAMFGWKTRAAAGEEQALIISIKLASAMGTDEERQHIISMEDELATQIEKSGAGEFDGDEFGQGVCTIYSYGPSADRLFSVAQPVLRKFHPPAGSFAIKRYGKPGAKQDRIEIDK